MMTDRQINALAAFIADGRPDWQPQGVAAALRACRDDYDGWQLAAAMIRRASKPGNRTPQLQDFDHTEPRITNWCRANVHNGRIPAGHFYARANSRDRVRNLGIDLGH